ncbi:hypothetical protein GN956_G18169 [Arapaima gigas]
MISAINGRFALPLGPPACRGQRALSGRRAADPAPLLPHPASSRPAHAPVNMDPRAGTQTATSQDLLSCGAGGGLQDKLLIKPKPSKSPGCLQTSRVPRSNVLDRLQRFLPQIAQANEKLRLEMESSPASQFDIENVEESEKVIEMAQT